MQSDASLSPDLVSALPSSVPTEPVRLLLTIEESAERLGIGRTLMYALVSSGAVESVRIGRLVRVPAESLPVFIRQLRDQQRESA
jgi:excisionase family DNA binding protein